MLLGFMSRISVTNDHGPLENRGCELKLASAPSIAVHGGALTRGMRERSARHSIRTLQSSRTRGITSEVNIGGSGHRSQNKAPDEGSSVRI